MKLVDPETLAGTDVEWRFTEEGDEVRSCSFPLCQCLLIDNRFFLIQVRVSKATGRIIPIPKQAYETIDYKTKSTYVENETKDTVSAVISEVSKYYLFRKILFGLTFDFSTISFQITFKPELKTFEMDIMDKMGIKEDRTPAKTYWY